MARSYPRVRGSGGQIYRAGTPVRCEVCGLTIPAMEPRAHCWVQVNWFRGDDEEGYVHLNCGVKAFIVAKKQVNRFEDKAKEGAKDDLRNNQPE
jgi:hypothetical protein